MSAERGRYFVVEPELSGVPRRSAAGGRVEFVFDGWLGDDLVRAYPAVLVTTRLKNALQALRAATGFRLSRARVRGSRFYRTHHPGRRLPPFWVVDVCGSLERDDMGVTPAGALVVSRRVLDLLLEFRVPRAVFAQYRGQAAAPRPSRA